MTARNRELLVGTLHLEVVSGPDRGKSIDSAHEIVVGTDAASSLVLSDPTVSRMHVAIAPAPGGWMLRDLGSTNGTEVAGVRVFEAIIAPGQTIRVGDTAIAVSDPGAVESRPLSEDTSWGRAFGKIAAMRELFAVLPRIASSGAVVLLAGETGTGKTLLADAIHRASARHRGPFVVVDCAAIAPTLVESDLFGHEKGSFTGAHAICSIASRRSGSACRRCATASRTSRCSPSTSGASSRPPTRAGSPPRFSTSCSAATGPATCASCAPLSSDD